MVSSVLRVCVSALVAVLLASSSFTAFPQPALFNSVKATSTLPVEDLEYADGTLVPEHSPLLIWYDWVNVHGTQVINYAIYTTPNYSYPVPIGNVLGQHFRLADDTQVFIASALSELEIYRDLDGDGVPKANFTSGESEIIYYMYTNMSDSYSMTPIQKAMEDSDPHYKWSFTYENVYAYLQNASARIGVVAALVFSHLTLSYDFSVKGNITNLKTNFDIGKVTSLNILDSSQFSLNGLSLALLYATATYTPKPYSTYVDGEQFNSATAEDSAIDAEIAQITVDGTKAYDFVFGGNYTLNRSESNTTHNAIIETYKAKAEAAVLSSIPFIIRREAVNGMGFFRNQLNLADLFGGSWQDFDINYENSSLIYRVCFPVWDGLQIQHDPVYVGYILSNAESPRNPEFPTMIALYVFITVIVVTLVLVIMTKRRGRPAKQD